MTREALDKPLVEIMDEFTNKFIPAEEYQVQPKHCKGRKCGRE